MTDTPAARLLAKAQAHLASRTFRFSVCLDDDRRDQLDRLRDAMERAANIAAMAEKFPAAEKPTQARRRTIGDRMNAAESAIEDIRAQTRALLDEAAANDDLLIVAFAIPAEARDHVDGPSGWYQDLKTEVAAAHTETAGRTAAIMATLAARSFVGVQTPTGDDIGMTWDDVRRHTLNDADVELILGGVLELYRGPSAVPFDPASYGRPTTN